MVHWGTLDGEKWHQSSYGISHFTVDLSTWIYWKKSLRRNWNTQAREVMRYPVAPRLLRYLLLRFWDMLSFNYGHLDHWNSLVIFCSQKSFCSSSLKVTEPLKKRYDMYVPFNAGHSMVSYFLHIDWQPKCQSIDEWVMKMWQKQWNIIQLLRK